MTFSTELDDAYQFTQFFYTPENASWSKCIETFAIDKIEDSKFKYVQELIDKIYSKQELFPNLKRIILDISACKANLSEVLVMPKFLESIEIVYFSGNTAVKESS